MAFIARKPCSFGGTRFLIGETVPSELVLPERMGSLISMGILAKIPAIPGPEFPEEKPKKAKLKGIKAGDT